MFEDIDVDESGRIDYEEFAQWWSNMNYFDVMGKTRFMDDVDGDWFDRDRIQKASEKSRPHALPCFLLPSELGNLSLADSAGRRRRGRASCRTRRRHGVARSARGF